MISIVLPSDHGKEKVKLDHYFVASDEPLFIGLILSPSDRLWPSMKNADSVILEIGRISYSFRIPYKIEVGRNSIFFVSPESGDPERILEALK
ncbi:MAG: hypothetical protein M1327_00130 [Candidatus Thermoplasmatota archaeon]|nr:hypothetical protein [Candidatus Thermoplasmatota archaeon]